MRNNDWKAIARFVGILLCAEGCLMALCLLPDLFHTNALTHSSIQALTHSSLFTLAVGAFLWYSFKEHRQLQDRRMAYLLVVLLWLVLSLFATLPFLASGATSHLSPFTSHLSPSAAWFEAMSGVTSCGATVFPDVASLPPSILLWRSVTQWFGGFGIVLLVLAVTPRLGINKYALYTAEASGADNSGPSAVRAVVTVRRTLAVYLSLTALFIILLMLSGMPLWDAVNLTFTNISSGGFSIYSASIASVTPLQQCILAAAMFLSGVTFTLLFLLFTLRWRQLCHKLDQFRFYLLLCLVAVLVVAASLHAQQALPWLDALRLAAVQTVSAVTTSGSVVADYTLWPVHVSFLLLVLAICGGMAGSTSGGLKIMRVVILMRNARASLHDRLHPHLVNPVRLNGRPVPPHLTHNVMVFFFVMAFTLMTGVMMLMLCGVSATEAIGAAVGCLTGYGPGLGPSGGFGCYAHFSPAALCFCSLLMLLGRLECLTVLVLLLPRFWRR